MSTRQERQQKFLERKLKEIASRGPMKVGARTVEQSGPRRPTIEGLDQPRRTVEAIISWRPVLVIEQDQFKIDPASAGGDNADLLAAVERQRAVLDAAIPAVGRIELANNHRFPWAGTGWLIDGGLGENWLVTNAHVANEFATKTDGRLIFRAGIPDFTQRQSATVDFREELGSADAREFAVTEIVWISENDALDMALLRVAREGSEHRLARPIPLWTGNQAGPQGNSMLAVIGYPGVGTGYDPQRFRELFGDTLEKKRFSPGLSTGVRNGHLTYDASTLPGSSGSVVLDVESGKAIGLHFAGTAFEANYAVGAADLRRVFADRPWRRPVTVVSPAPNDVREAGVSTPVVVTTTTDGGEIRIELSLKIAFPGSGAASPASARSNNTQRASSAADAAGQVRERLKGNRDVLSVSEGFLFKDGEITDDLGVIVGVRPGASEDPAGYGLGATYAGIPVSVEIADPETLLEKEVGITREAFSGRRAQYSRDLTEARFRLDEVTDDMTIRLHVSPEAGWRELKTFLERQHDKLAIGMYHMTAPHVVEAIEAVAARAAITLTLDRQRGEAAEPDDTGGPTKADDIPESETLENLEAIGQEFKWAPASLGAAGLFATAYHIKVATWSNRTGTNRDKAVWLSSGNWQSSNQANIEKPIAQLTWNDVGSYNREWHAIVEHAGLARTFRNHLEQDYTDNEAASGEQETPRMAIDVLVPIDALEAPRRPSAFDAFEPEPIQGNIRVQPLLTPDNYPEVIADLIAGAQERVLIENQSFGIWKEVADMPAHFVRILDAIKDRQEAGLDVRIIFRSGYGKERETIRRMKSYGFRVGAANLRYFDTCHTKGFVIDQNIAVLGSHNLTAAGTGPNRDASLVIWNRKANEYFARLFEYDWAQLTDRRTRRPPSEGVRFVRSDVKEPVPAGFRRISLAEYLGEG